MDEQKKARIADFLASCDKADICYLFDSTAFNEIVQSYVFMGISTLVREKNLTEKQAEAIQKALKTAFDEMNSSQALSLATGPED